MSLFKNIGKDINAAHKFLESNKLMVFFFNRGFHALFFYRLSNKCYKWHIPIVPMLLTRIIQIMYSIDIDYKADIAGGVVIVHGVGLVIGFGVNIQPNVVLFHGVTLGRKGYGPLFAQTDGFPVVEEDCVICAGAKLLGKIVIGKNSTIGANSVVTASVPANSVYKLASSNFITYHK